MVFSELEHPAILRNSLLNGGYNTRDNFHRRGSLPNETENRLRILFLSAEAAPLIKVGGLADFAGALPAQLRRSGHDVRLVLPLHPSLRRRVAELKPVARPAVSARGSSMQAEAYLIEENGAPVYLVDGPPLRASDAIYHADAGRDTPKYVFFSLAALELARCLDWKPDLVHTNDWHTAAANLWLAGHGRRDRFFRAVRSVLSVHNLPYVGENAGWALAQFGLGVPEKIPATRPNSDAAEYDRFAALPAWAYSTLLPLGLAAADRIITVSPSYAQEILTPEFGAGLEEYLLTQQDRIEGILNGLDQSAWDPATDARLASNFDPATVDRRADNKAAVQKMLNWAPDPRTPLLGMVTRLNEQKGIDLALPALDCWCERGNQVAILGAGDPYLEQRCRAFAARHPGRAAAEFGYQDELAARIYGGSDAFLIPSRYEPCGTSQMIAMRYGSLPVVRAVGGLKDTVRDAAEDDGTGVMFGDASPTAVAMALGRTEEILRVPGQRSALQLRGMRRDFDWARSAEAYIAAYRRVLAG
jgi:starch synthase